MKITDNKFIDYKSFFGEDNESTCNNFIAIGWLENKNDITIGEVDVAFIKNLFYLCRYHSINHMRGLHSCKFCPFDDKHFPVKTKLKNEEAYLGSAEIHVPINSEKSYLSPNMIIHYVKDHNYKPPQDFIDTVNSYAENLRQEENKNKSSFCKLKKIIKKWLI